MTSGYSGKPLAQKMSIKVGQRIIILHAPEGYEATLGAALDEVEVAHELNGTFDLIQIFVTERAVYEREFPILRDALTTAGMLWVSGLGRRRR